jgi:hypothetical protein
VEGELRVNDFNVQFTQGGIYLATQGAFFSDTVVSTDGVLNIVLGGSNPAAIDNNAILNGLTLEVERSRVTGDSNGDGIFNSSDLIVVFTAGEYEDAIAGNSTFEEGDWNGDRDFDTQDLVAAFQAGTYVANAVKSVPYAGTEQVAAAVAHAAPEVDNVVVRRGRSSAKLLRQHEKSHMLIETEELETDAVFASRAADVDDAFAAADLPTEFDASIDELLDESHKGARLL